MVSGKSLPTSPFRKGLAPALSSRVDPVAKGLPKNMPFLGSLHPVMEGAGPGQEPFQLNMGCACPRPPRGWSNASQIFLTVLMSFCPILLQPLTFHRCLSKKKKKKIACTLKSISASASREASLQQCLQEQSQKIHQ